jgi:DNA-binding CsgD family transcriptional regulator/DNA-binding Xre family transcriptional regulator
MAAMTPLAALLTERGISQDELVQRTGLTHRTVSHAYHGRSVSLRTWVKIALALDVKLAELDPDATEGRDVRSMMDASEWFGETLTLTPLQFDILVLVVNGLTNREITDRLGLRPGLIGTLIGRLTWVLGVTTRAELAAIGTGGGMSR